MGALSGLRVLDFGRYVAGPYCATLLADFGADTIRVERIGGGEDRAIGPVTEFGDGAMFLQVNRNKRSITLDPRTPGGADVTRRLAASADIVVVNVPNSALKKMGLDYATLSALRPDIILANVSSFGPVGPWSDRPGFDSVGQAMCGSAYLSGPGDRPYRTPITWVDHASAVFAAFGIMVALHERARTGRGQQIDGSLLGSALAYASTSIIEEAILGLGRTAIGNRSFLNAPTDTFQTKDGWIVTQVVGRPLFLRWLALVGEDGWADDARFATDDSRAEHGAFLSARMSQWCAERTTDDALAELAKAGVPAGPVLSPREAFAHEQVRAMNFFAPTEVAGLDRPAPLGRPPVALSATPGEIRLRPPTIGEHTAEILTELGFSDAEIDELRRTGAV